MSFDIISAYHKIRDAPYFLIFVYKFCVKFVFVWFSQVTSTFIQSKILINVHGKAYWSRKVRWKTVTRKFERIDLPNFGCWRMFGNKDMCRTFVWASLLMISCHMKGLIEENIWKFGKIIAKNHKWDSLNDISIASSTWARLPCNDKE